MGKVGDGRRCLAEIIWRGPKQRQHGIKQQGQIEQYLETPDIVRNYLSRLSSHEPACLYTLLLNLSNPVGPISQ